VNSLETIINIHVNLKIKKMKQVKITMPRRALTLVCGLALAATAFGQQVVVKGHVVDATGEPVIGATVRVKRQDGGCW
jgi:iron complex outermembrane receptor protein